MYSFLSGDLTVPAIFLQNSTHYLYGEFGIIATHSPRCTETAKIELHIVSAAVADLGKSRHYSLPVNRARKRYKMLIRKAVVIVQMQTFYGRAQSAYHILRRRLTLKSVRLICMSRINAGTEMRRISIPFAEAAVEIYELIRITEKVNPAPSVGCVRVAKSLRGKYHSVLLGEFGK